MHCTAATSIVDDCVAEAVLAARALRQRFEAADPVDAESLVVSARRHPRGAHELLRLRPEERRDGVLLHRIATEADRLLDAIASVVECHRSYRVDELVQGSMSLATRISAAADLIADAWPRANAGRTLELTQRGMRHLQTEGETAFRRGLSGLTGDGREIGWVLARREILTCMRECLTVAGSALDAIEQFAVLRARSG